MHDGCAEAMLQIWREANVHFIHEPRTIFASLVPPRELLRDQPRAKAPLSIVPLPDAAVDLALSATGGDTALCAAGPHATAVDPSPGRL